MIVHPDPVVADVARRFPSVAVLATAGDPFYLPIAHTVCASGYDPGPLPETLLERCALALEVGLAILVAAPTEAVRDDGMRQIMDRACGGAA